MQGDLLIRPIAAGDAGEIFTLQRAAFVQEAELYRTVDIPALTQSLGDLESELAASGGLVALIRNRIVGSVRARTDGDLLLISRLAVAPDMQGRGIGTALLAAVEARSDALEAELFTGSLSEPNLRLYRREGYVETGRIVLPEVELVYLRKRLR
ncbi:GNAT family N-acetyltransferase [Microbacterium sp. P01]|uniref:GNAT family N-acetyltransferase n=1 Tax=unclassified Microbacterium TaxID=2609290 RepID=UPI00366DF8CB